MGPGERVRPPLVYGGGNEGSKAALVLFAFAFLLAELLAWLERRVEYYAASRTI